MALCLPLSTIVALFTALIVVFSAPATAFDLGLAWGANNKWAHELTTNQHIRYYHHWQGRHVSGISRAGVEFVPMRWGPKKNKDWPKIKKLFPKYKYKHTLAYNEPDVPTQADLSPKKAANLWVKELAPLRQRYGTKVSSPQICYDVDWLSKFMKHLNKRGEHPSFISAHYYGSWKSMSKLRKYIHKIHRRWPDQKIWITEYGVTSSSNPSAAQAKQFMVEATNFFASTGYVEAAFPFGMFAEPPDAFGSQQNAAFTSSGRLRSLGRFYKHYNSYKRSVAANGQLRGAMRRRHEHLLKRLEQPDPSDEELWDNHLNETHCDDLCQKRDLVTDTDDDHDDGSEADDDDGQDDDAEDTDAFTEEDAKYWPTEEDEKDDDDQE